MLKKLAAKWGPQVGLLLLTAAVSFVGGSQVTKANVEVNGDRNTVTVRTVEENPLKFCQEASSIKSAPSLAVDGVSGVDRTAVKGTATLEWLDNGENSVARFILPGSPTGPIPVALDMEAMECLRVDK